MSGLEEYNAFQNRFKNRKYIGSGGFAQVFKVFDHAKNHYVALKMADVKPEWKKFTLKNEVELVNKLPLHRNIARYDNCYRFDTGITGTKDFAILKFYEYGNLEQFLATQKETLSSEDKRLIIRGVLDGIAFLHQNNVIHRDLKAQNILLHREDGIWTPKITDFGLSRQVIDKADITNSAIGISFAYAAPEQILNNKIFTNVDLWAMGVIIYRIIVNELPFKGRSGGDDRSTQSQMELSRKITKLELPEKLETIEEPYKTMIKRCLVLDPKERIQTAEELILYLKGTKSFQDPVPVQIPQVEQGFLPISDDNKTVVVPSDEVEDMSSLPKVEEPEPFQPPVVEPPTEIINSDPAENNPYSGSVPMPPSYFPPTTYNQPNSNPTQIQIESDNDTTEPPKPITTFEPSSGDQKGFNWLWLLIPLFIAIAVFVVWKYFPANPENKVSEESSITSDPAPPVGFEEPTQEATLEGISDRNDRSKSNKNGLLSIQTEIKALSRDETYKNNYKVNYLLAKNQAYLCALGDRKNCNTTLSTLIATAEIAIKNNSAKEMLDRLREDENEVFAKQKNIEDGIYWQKIINYLNAVI